MSVKANPESVARQRTHNALDKLWRMRELRAEARAWRRAAEGYTDERPLFRYLAPFGALCHATPYTPVAVAAQRRQEAHRALSPFFDFADIEACVWCCLFLALECEDEARALGRGKTPDRRSAR